MMSHVEIILNDLYLKTHQQDLTAICFVDIHIDITRKDTTAWRRQPSRRIDATVWSSNFMPVGHHEFFLFLFPENYCVLQFW